MNNLDNKFTDEELQKMFSNLDYGNTGNIN